jgi:hypothetical protein
MAGPNWCNPGTSKVQQRRAEHFDPYPLVTARSEMTGVRPRDYDQPSDDDYKPWSPWSPGAARR